jgi:hypothetical protein
MWQRAVRNDAQANGQTITNLYGRSRTYLGRWDKALWHQMYAFCAQSAVADHINEFGILEMWNGRFDRYRGFQLLIQIHDSLLFQVNLALGWPAVATGLRMLCEVLETPIIYGPRSLSIPTNVKIYPNNFRDGYEWKDRQPGPTALEQMYKKMRADNGN